MKVRIFQPIVPEFRVALFDGLSDRFSGNVEVHASTKWFSDDWSVPLKHCTYDYSHRLLKIGPFVWQRGFSLKGLSAKEDVVVINGDIHQLSTLWIALQCKIKGIPIVWWGHHISVGSTRLSIAIRLVFARLLSDVVLCYTKQGVDWFKARGWKAPVFATGNTIDMVAVKRAVASWTSEDLSAFQKEKGIANKDMIVFCSVLRWKTHLEQLLHAMSSDELKARNTKLVVIGDGEGRPLWEQLAKDLGIADRVIWVGALRDQMKIAPWFMSAKAYVYPGPIGLSIIHAFSYGLPVVCHNNSLHHGPEFEAMNNGVTGFVFKENDATDLARQIVCLLTHENERCTMSRSVQKLAYTKYGMDSMVKNFSEAVMTASRISKGE